MRRQRLLSLACPPLASQDRSFKMSPTRVLALGRGFLAGFIILFYTPRVVAGQWFMMYLLNVVLRSQEPCASVQLWHGPTRSEQIVGCSCSCTEAGWRVDGCREDIVTRARWPPVEERRNARRAAICEGVSCQRVTWVPISLQDGTYAYRSCRKLLTVYRVYRPGDCTCFFFFGNPFENVSTWAALHRQRTRGYR